MVAHQHVTMRGAQARPHPLQRMRGVHPAPCRSQGADADVLHYSIRAVSAAQSLQGSLLEADSPAAAEGGDPDLLGAVEGVEAGAATGWACLRNAPTQRVEVRAQPLGAAGVPPRSAFALPLVSM